MKQLCFQSAGTPWGSKLSPSFAGSTVYIPSFDGTSYLELQPLTSLLKPPAAANQLTSAVKDDTVTLQLTVKTSATQGTLLYSECIQHYVKLLVRVRLRLIA